MSDTKIAGLEAAIEYLAAESFGGIDLGDGHETAVDLVLGARLSEGPEAIAALIVGLAAGMKAALTMYAQTAAIDMDDARRELSDVLRDVIEEVNKHGY